MHEKKYMKHLLSLRATFMTGVGLEVKQIVVWFDIRLVCYVLVCLPCTSPPFEVIVTFQL